MGVAATSILSGIRSSPTSINLLPLLGCNAGSSTCIYLLPLLRRDAGSSTGINLLPLLRRDAGSSTGINLLPLLGCYHTSSSFITFPSCSIFLFSRIVSCIIL
ncbi:hypothetical protein BRADI_2g25656v3 [Brachypodium distachyon]|uniref:Uncharacterized protein n=1 Tax=Brachypodium distachyon TaxID=15368 RepID=A0A2K2DAH6_BRADI|nr:hypothetical protein BRADI_2g25656v3 [Brachypodium distachyon]